MKEKKVSHGCELKISDWYIQLTFIYDFPIIFYLNIHSKYSTIIMKELVVIFTVPVQSGKVTNIQC